MKLTQNQNKLQPQQKEEGGKERGRRRRSLAKFAISMEVFAISHEIHFRGKSLKNTKPLRVCRPFHFWLCLSAERFRWIMRGQKDQEGLISPWLGF